MAEHIVTLNDEKHRTISINKDLSEDPKVNVTMVYKKSPSGNMTNYLIIRSTGPEKLFTDLEIPTGKSGVKIPPDVDR